MLKLGIFEIGTTDHTDDLNVIENTIELAKLGDELGFSRFWLGEHHESGVAWRSPEILMTILAGYTDTIKIGSAGVLLPLTSPLRVAQNFKMLGSLFSNRIDLGIARGVTSESASKKLLNGIDRELFIRNHIARTKELVDFLRNTHIPLSETDKDEFIVNTPVNGKLPEIWMLGASGSTTDFAIGEQLNYALSLLHTPNDHHPKAKEIFLSFLNKYEETNNVKPVTNITISLICAETKQHCDEILSHHKNNFTINIIGNVDECYEQIKTISKEYQTDEIMLQLFSPDFKHKFLMFEKLAEKFQISNTILK